MNAASIAEANRIFYCRAGSRAYGLHTCTSDEDFRGVFVGLPANVLGLHTLEHCQLSGDNMLYELRKFVVLAANCNPNIVEFLYTDPQDTLLTTPWWQRLVDNRHLFLTRKARHTFSGYAAAQMKKISSHNKWLNDPQPVGQPNPGKFLKSKYIEGLGHREVFDQVAFATAHKQWKQYWEWKETRNPQRAMLEEAHGYDTKHAMHLVRLLRMGTEILRGQGVIVKRPDREELLAIRNGEMPYADLVALAQNYEAQMESLYETAPLPHAPDLKAIEALLLGIYQDFWGQKGQF